MNAYHFSKKPNKTGRILSVLFLMIFFIAGNGLTDAQIDEANKPVLVTCQWLDENISDPGLVILHISAIVRNYENGHIPGSRFLWPGWLSVSNETETTVPAGIKQIKKVLEGLGISNKSYIVLCGSGVNLVVVSRVFVTLSHYGLAGRISILQGGFEEWKASGMKVSSERPEFKKGKLVLIKQDNIVGADWMVSNLKSETYYIIDARSEASYDGTSGTPRQGHIPGAKNLPASSLYDAKTWHFASEEKIMELFNRLDIPHNARPVFYCGTGNSACIDYVAALIAGYKPILYDGSMEEWSSRLDLPMEKLKCP
jgi:thiosulfate/3-mercaptopyruvate sulfurtransferase